VSYYFKTKDSIGEAVIERLACAYEMTRETWESTPDPKARLVAFVQMTVNNRESRSRKRWRGIHPSVAILLEETRLPYRLVPVNIGRGEQFRPEFLALSPNNRMPALVDHEPVGGGAPLTIFESGQGATVNGQDGRRGEERAVRPEGAEHRVGQHACVRWLRSRPC
jgi:hypothetical protein